MRTTLGVLIALGSSVAVAQPEPENPPDPPDVTASSEVPPPPETETCPSECPAPPPPPAPLEPAHALPGSESGFVDDTPPEDSSGRKVARALLIIPKSLVQIVIAPVRLGVWVDEKYHPEDRFHRWFFNDSDTFGLYPTLGYETDYSFRVGARMVLLVHHTDQIHASASTSFDGLRQHVSLDYTALRLDDRLDLDLRMELHRRQNEQFYGIGNEDNVAPPDMPIDLSVDDTAVQTRYSSRLGRAAVSGGYRLASDFQIRAAADVGKRYLGNGSTGESIETVYAPMSLVGFPNYDFGYGEAEVRWDTRGTSYSLWDTPTVVSHGTLLSLWGGGAALSGGQSFFRYGADAHHYIRVGGAPRVIAARFHGEGITAPSAEVPFTELPTLGGAHYLRGYPIDRFRDRVSAVGSLEYQWDLSRIFFASVFVDAGRVYSSVNDLTLRDLRIGYGVSLELQQERFHGIRGSIASSKDGGVFLDLYFEPVFNLKPRVERK